MGDAFIVRRGGGAGLSKCTIVIHVETGSTVGAYSNSAATTLVKSAKEIGTSGDYFVTGLETGTYYIKATKSGKTAIKAVTCSAYGIFETTITYEVVLFENGTISFLGNPVTISRTEGAQVEYDWKISGNDLYLRAVSSSGTAAVIYGGFNNAYDFTGRSALNFSAYGDGTVGINSTNTTSMLASVQVSGSTITTYSIPLASYQDNYRIIVYSRAPTPLVTKTMHITRIWVT